MTLPTMQEAAAEGIATTFIESECEIGGCLCPIWNDWFWWQVEFVQQHPRAVKFSDITDDDQRMDAEDELTEELRLTGELPDYKAPICERPSCLRFTQRLIPNAP